MGFTSREIKDVLMLHNPTVSQKSRPQTNKFEMYYKNGQEEYSK